MLKIAYIGQKGVLNPSGGGIETNVEELSVRMANKGHKVFLYTRPHYTPAEYKKYENVNLISIKSIHTKHLDALSHSFFSILHAVRNKMDIIHIHGVGPSVWSWLPRIISPKIKVISTAHSDDWNHQKWGWFARTSLKFGAWMSAKTAHDVMTVSKELQKRFLSLYNRSIKLIPNGVFTETINTNDELIKKFDLKKGKYILAVSRLIRHKGIHYLIQAFKELKKDKKYKDYKLVIVGDASFTGSYAKFLKKMVNGNKDIIFTGPQRGETLEQIFSNAYVYVSPSMAEGLSISLLEAMSYANATLVSDIPENLELVNGDSTLGSVGFSFKNKNIPDLTEKLKILLDNPKIVRQVGQKARKYVKAYYNWNDIVDRIDKVYMGIVTVKNKVKSQSFRQFALKRA